MTQGRPSARTKPEQALDELEWPRGTGTVAARELTAAGYPSFLSLSGVSRVGLLRIHGVGPKALRIIDEELRVRDLEGLAP